MIVVINRVILAKPIDSELLHKLEADFIPGIQRQPGFRRFELVRISDSEAVVIVHYEDADSMKRIGAEYATPWFDTHVRPYLGGPPQRSVGELVYSSSM